LEAVHDFHHFISRSLAPNVVKLKWSLPQNVTSPNNVKAYRLLRGMTPVFSAAVEIATTTRTSFIETNDTGAMQTYFYWVIPIGAAGEGPPSEVVAVTVVSN
jgi:hypothetical protein